MNEETSSLEDIYLTLVKEADEQYAAEMKAIKEGVDLDEVFADKDDESEDEEAESEDKAEDDSKDENESEEDSKEDSKEEE